ncbi:MAG TPA: VWA domain-containing protein [Chitinophagales bacterium]|nr:VWA domain-containing protein [Chitinophagales bacterium]HRK25658.1 VWA domain-containing protein [Chitinophagales bacterium]
MNYRLLVLVFCLLVTAQIWANGFFVGSPKDYYWYPTERESSYFKAFPDGFNPCFIELMSDKQNITIDGDSVTVQITQTYYNISPDTLQIYYLLPLPSGAEVKKLDFSINQDEYRPEYMEPAKSFKVFKDMVRRTGNPNWWAYANNGLFKVNIYKAPPRSVLAVKASYKYKLTPEANRYRFEHLLSTQQFSAKPPQDTEFNLTIKHKDRLGNFYCPTHNALPAYVNEKQVTYKFNAKKGRIDKDFLLYYSTSNQNLGYSLFTHKQAGKPGYFMLSFDAGYGQVTEEKDMVFAIDLAETMTTAQLDKVKKALTNCLKKLGTNDRFNVVTFSNLAESAFPDFVAPTSANITQATTYLNNAKTQGKANYEGAFNKALHFSKDPMRPYYVFLVSAGEPQVGIVIDHEELLEEIDVANVRTLRMFTVGIGNNANAAFLERAANYTQGEALFIADDNSIETGITAFYEMVSNPVLVNLQLYFGDKFEVQEMYPKKPNNLFKDQPLYILGKYKKGGKTTVSLIGDAKKMMQRYDFTVDFPEASDAYPFVPTLWAGRAIGDMLNQLKAAGSDLDGTGEEIADLADEHFIINPYTAHLLLKEMKFLSPDKKRYAPRMLTQAGTDYAQDYAGVTQQKGANALLSSLAASALLRAYYLPHLQAGQQNMTFTDLKGATQKGVNNEYKWVNSRLFYQNADNLLTDAATQNKGEGEKIFFASDAYAAIATPELAPYLQLSKQIRIEAGGKVYDIVEAPPAETKEGDKK